MERNNWSVSTFSLVDWDSYEIAMKKQRNESKTRLTKHAHDWLPAGHQQQHTCTDQDPTCPTCKEPGLREKTDHVIRCNKRKTKRDKCLSDMKAVLTKIKTNNYIKDTICKGIVNWMLRPYGNFPAPRWRKSDKLTELLTEAVKEQNVIGWNNFMKGRISYKWGEAQQVHYSEKQKTANTDQEKQEAKHHTGELLQMRLTIETFKMFETLWESRNLDYHENTDRQNDKSLREKRMIDKAKAL